MQLSQEENQKVKYKTSVPVTEVNVRASSPPSLASWLCSWRPSLHRAPPGQFLPFCQLADEAWGGFGQRAAACSLGLGPPAGLGEGSGELCKEQPGKDPPRAAPQAPRVLASRGLLLLPAPRRSSELRQPAGQGLGGTRQPGGDEPCHGEGAKGAKCKGNVSFGHRPRGG